MHFHCSPSRSQSGFALLVTITLVAFLVLLLVSFASLTRVETQVAGNSRQLASSQENALMALNLAIGQLQKYAGPDQRVTAPSDAGTSTVSPDRSDSRPHWTGIWRNTIPGANTSSRQLLTWLVSGNEDESAPLQVKPTDAVADPDTDSTAVWLVHDGAALQSGGAGAPEQYVKLVKQGIKTGSVPGLADVSGGHTVGRYAWWVGDEGVKARVNMIDPHSISSIPAERGLSFTTSQGVAINLMDRGTSTTLLGTAYPGPADTTFHDKLDQIEVPAQLTYASNEPVVMTTAAKAHFHDMTTASFGILADVAQGGLKKDLSAGLSAGATTPADNDPIFPVNAGDGSYDVPRWSLLRSYANTQVATGASLAPQPIAPQTIGTDRPLGSGPATFSPIVTYAGVGVDYLLGPGASLSIDVHLFPCVVLWNPYSVPLAAKDYTIIFYPRVEDAYLVELTREPNYAISGGYDPSRPLKFALDRPFRHAGNNGPLHCRFKVVCPVIPAGQSLIFTLPASLRGAQTPYQPGRNELVNELNPDVSVVIPTNQTATSELEKFKLFAYDSTRETAFVLCDFDSTGTYNPAGSSPYESAPPLNTPRWYQTVQRMRAVLRNNNFVTSAQSLAHAPPSGPSFVWEMYAGFSASTHFDSQWIAHDNPRAPLSTRARSDGQGEDTFTGGNTNYVYNSRKVSSPPGVWPGFNYNATIARASAGRSLDVGADVPTDVVLFEQPSPTLGLLSIGQLQQAPLSRVGFYPAYAVGNSLAPIRLSRDVTSSNAGTSTFNVTKLLTTHYDLSWKLNRALWDRYFFSTVPSGAAPGPTLMNNGTSDVARPALTQADIDAGNPLPNSRMHYHADGGSLPLLKHLLKTSDADSDPYNQAAANLLVTGAFNINSTSEQAWRAVLAGTFGIDYKPETRAAGTVTLKAAFPRFAAPTSDDNPSDTWRGYRQLDESQIARLAANIVAQVKARGPFLSLADFVNRNLALDETGLKGALQAALDATTSGSVAANDSAQSPFNQNLVTTAPASNYGTFYFDHMRNDTAASTAAHASRNAFAPKFLTQGDILAALGSALTARSDTFKIRAYGETVNPLLAPTDPNYITSRSWCEAIVQRMPEYVDPSVNANAWDSPASGSDGEKFGRRFKVVSFRWLTDSDL